MTLLLRLPDGDVRPQSHRRLRRPDVARPGGVLRHRRLHRGDPDDQARLSVLARAADRRGRLLRRRPGARAFRRCACSTTTSRSRRWASTCCVFLVMRNEEKLTGGTFGISNIPRPSLFGYSLDGALPFFYFTLVSVIAAGAACCGGCCARRGAARSRRCATTRSAPRASASTSPPTRCSRSRSARPARASAASISPSLVQFHRAGPVPPVGVADDAARGHRRRLGPLLRSGARHR